MNCNNFNNFNTNGDIAVKFEVNVFYATMGLFAMLFNEVFKIQIFNFTAISPLVLELLQFMSGSVASGTHCTILYSVIVSCY
ncbi:hypothetical protein C0J52_23679 [Blattella germanica]|nr:hypothetical protein C0J52_23679 [Blattella germanica]